MPVEGDFLEAYAAMPRRAEWVRRTLLRGFVEEMKRLADDDDPYEGATIFGKTTAVAGTFGEFKGDDRS